MFSVPRRRTQVDPGTISMTKQSHKAECDINTIISQYQKTGIITHINNNKSEYLDLPNDYDFQHSMNIVLTAQESFSTLPSKVRDFFHNNPGEFLAAFNNPNMRPQLEEWGLINPAPAAAPEQPSPKVSEA